MKTKTIISILLLFSFFACKTRKVETDIRESKQTDTSLAESGQREKSSDVSGSFNVAKEGSAEWNTRQNGGSVQLTAPDSAGNQYPVFISWYGNEISEKTAENTNINADYTAKISELEKTISELESKTAQTSAEETVTKTGLTLLEKIGIAAIILLVLTGIYMAVKWWLKKQIPTI